MIPTKYALEQMGYIKYPESDSLEIHFGIMKIYSLRGIVFEINSPMKLSEKINFGKGCTAVISESVNEAYKLLVDEVYTDDEEKWVEEKKATPPFLLIYFKESASRTLLGGHRLEKDGNIYTWDAFPKGKLEIRNWENEILPNIITSLTVNLSSLDRQIELVPVDRRVFGTTNKGKTVLDLKMTSSATAYGSAGKKLEEINSMLDKSRKHFIPLKKGMCKHFYLALNEPDRLKKFLGYFYFIERLTHSTFKTLNYESDALKTFNVPTRIEGSMNDFFKNAFSESKNLSQRFYWCAMLAWDSIEENDVTYFRELKDIRDRLSHGEHIHEAMIPVEKAKDLAMKLLGTK